jgi:hypothetical protein
MPEARQTPPGSGTDEARHTRILLADDDDDLRKLLRAFLEADGYEVFSCSDGLRAFEVFASRSDIDLVLTDLQMPRMSGLELSRIVSAARPGLPVVIISGAMIPDELLELIAASGWQFLAKPYRMPELLQIIHTQVMRARKTVALRAA